MYDLSTLKALNAGKPAKRKTDFDAAQPVPPKAPEEDFNPLVVAFNVITANFRRDKLDRVA